MLCLAGCIVDKKEYDTQLAIAQASFDHSCPPEQIQVVEALGQGEINQSYTFKMNVCGRRRVYKDVGDRSTIFVDTTRSHE